MTWLFLSVKLFSPSDTVVFYIVGVFHSWRFLYIQSPPTADGARRVRVPDEEAQPEPPLPPQQPVDAALERSRQQVNLRL